LVKKLIKYNETVECFNKALDIKPESNDALETKEEVLKLIEK
jgi:hypothetical protein